MTFVDPLMFGSYDHGFVALSVVIAVFASYVALDLAQRLRSAKGITRTLCLTSGAMAMGIGIWSMNYVGMLAFHLPVRVRYDWVPVSSSLFAAIYLCFLALSSVSRKKMTTVRVLRGSVFMGAAIGSIHYGGMAAMRLPARCQYSLAIVTISLLLPIVISFGAFWLAFRERVETRSAELWTSLSAGVMGAAITVMHYTGMAAVSFTSSTSVNGGLSLMAVNIDPATLSISALSTAGMVVVTFMVLGHTMLTARIDRSEQALRLESNEMRYRKIVGTALDAFVGMDSNGKVVEWNAQAEATFGWSCDEAIGQALAQLIVPQRHRAAFEKGLRDYLISGDSPVLNRRIEVTALHRHGREFPIELTITVMQPGDLHLFTAFIRDITERKRAEAELKSAKEVAEAANEAKSTFLATMSHEIRTPMNGVLGMTELVLDSDLTAEQRENLGLVRLSAESLLSIINDILDFSKIEAGKFEIELIPFDLRESLGETMKSLSVRAHQKGLELIYDVQPDVPEAVLGDPGRIRQILVNLVGNAIKFTDKGEVFIYVEEESHEDKVTCLHFTVKDTGVGVPADKQRTIFDAFSQADGSMARKFGGTGLGLTICSRLVDMAWTHLGGE